MIRRKATIKFRRIALPLTLVAVQITKRIKDKRVVCKCMITKIYRRAGLVFSPLIELNF